MTGEDGKELDRKTAAFTVSGGSVSKTNKTTKRKKVSSDEVAEEQTEKQEEDPSKEN